MAKYFTNEQLSGQIVKEATFTVLKTSSSQEILEIPGGDDVVSTRWNSDGALMVDVIHPNGGKGRYFFLGQHVRYGGILPDDCSSNRPTSSSDLRRYMSDMQAANQQRDGGSSSSQSSSSGSFAKGVATGAAVVGAINKWADKREAQKQEAKAAQQAAAKAAHQKALDMLAELKRKDEEKEEWLESLPEDEKKYRKELQKLVDDNDEKVYNLEEKLKKLPVPSEEKFIDEFKSALKKSKESDSTPKNVLDHIQSFGKVPKDIKEELKDGMYVMELQNVWKERVKVMAEHALKSYKKNPEIYELIKKECPDIFKEYSAEVSDKRFVFIFWGVYALAALILFCSVEEWWAYILVILALIAVAAIRIFYVNNIK